LKVRFKALIKALTSANASSPSTIGNATPRAAGNGPGLPPSKVTGFLVGLIEEDNYFPKDFLYACEDEVMTKNSLGGTRGVVAMASTEDEALRYVSTNPMGRTLAETDRRLVQPIEIDIPLPKNPSNNSSAPTNTDASSNEPSQESKPSTDAAPAAASVAESNTIPIAKLKRYAHSGAVRLLLLDTLLVRVLITRVVLTPWHAQVTSVPTNRHTRRVTHNLRVLASLCYLLARRMNPQLPTREEMLPMTQFAHKQPPAMSLFSHKAPNGMTEPSVVVSAAAAAAAAGTSSTETKPGPESTGDATTAAGSPTNGDGKQAEVDKGIFGAFLRMTGFADTTPGHEDFQAGSMEYALLAPRLTPYETLPETMKFLVARGQLQPSVAVSELFDAWIEEVAPLVRDWLDDIVAHVLQAYLQKHYKRLFMQPDVPPSHRL
jgi:hypothetical protein